MGTARMECTLLDISASLRELCAICKDILLIGTCSYSSPNLSLNHKKDKNDKEKKDKISPSAIIAKHEDEIVAVIKHLNERAKTRYRPWSEGLGVQYLAARLEDGFSVDDCKIVIDRKTDEWYNTDHAKYLRPITLFCKSKYQGYLNQPVVAKPPTEEEKAKAYEESFAKRMAEEEKT
jgi:uncharacterized phage protein (TIGR02220 family)